MSSRVCCENRGSASCSDDDDDDDDDDDEFVEGREFRCRNKSPRE